jgi:ubiquinone/menaquinone biosynthesis C-methylase UbiE
MLNLAGVGRGSRVLDVAAGAGEPAITIAQRVGPTGYVFATDISSSILEFAARAVLERGLDNVGTQVMDGEHLELTDESSMW